MTIHAEIAMRRRGRAKRENHWTGGRWHALTCKHKHSCEDMGMGFGRGMKVAAAAAALVTASFAAPEAQATTITLTYSNPDSTVGRAEVTCSLGCEARFLGEEDYFDANWAGGFWNAPDGTLFSRGVGPEGNGNNPDSRLAITNLVLGTSYGEADRTETGTSSVFTSSAETLLVWIGTQGNPSTSFRYALIRNTQADNVFSWSGLPRGGGGLSGYDGFGVIPLPAAGWLLLGGLGALGAVGYRRRKQAA